MRAIIVTISVAIGYFLLAFLGQIFVVGDTNISPVWPPAGYALGLAILYGNRILPGVALGAFGAAFESFLFTDTSLDTGVASSLIISLVVTLQAYFGLRILSLWMHPVGIVSRGRDFVLFAFLCPLLALISATVGLLLLTLLPNYSWSTFPEKWVLWWFADITGLLIVTPTVVMVAAQSYVSERIRLAFLMLLMLLVTITVSAVTVTSLYGSYIDAQEHRLQELSSSYAAMLDVSTRSQRSSVDGEARSEASMLTEMRPGFSNLPGFRESGVLYIGQNLNGVDSVVGWLLLSDKGMDFSGEVPEVGLPMQRALAGSSGIYRGPDARGIDVIAGYAPVTASGQGVVIKVDMAEIRQPFLDGAIMSVTTVLVLIAMAGLIFFRISSSILKRLEVKAGGLERMVQQRTTEIEEARESLANQLSFQHALLDTIPNPVFYMDDGLRVLGVNAAYERVFQVAAVDVVGKTIMEMDRFSGPARFMFQKRAEELVDSEHQIETEMKVPLEDGTVKDTLFFAAGFPRQDGTRGGVVGTFVDISEQKEIERELAAAKEAAEAATAVKANFLASMSHEIRTPMNGIIGMVELLLNSNLSDDDRVMLETISESGEGLLAIINDILDFSKIEAGRLELESINLDLTSIAEGVAESLNTMAAPKGIRLLTDIDPDIRPGLMGDPVRLRQVLTNLVGNAIKFSEGGVVEIRVSALSDSNDVQEIKFSIIDEGIGIAPETQAGLFDAFTQAESSTTRKFGGTGLGLSISKRLVEIMGGDISVESEPGKGSTFDIVIPFPCGAGNANLLDGFDLSGLVIAIVSPDSRESGVCERYLKHAGARVEVLSAMCGRKESKRFDTIVVSERKQVPREFLKVLAADSDAPSVVLLRTGTYPDRTVFIGERILAVDVSPLKRRTLLVAVAIVNGRKSPEPDIDEVSPLLLPQACITVEDARRQGALVLVAEDNSVNRQVIRRQLNLLGYACELVGDGEKAWKALANSGYGVLLTDCHMPEIDGFELTKRVRSRERQTGEHLPVIAITANAMIGESERCIAAGMDDYLSKPLKLEQLKEKLVAWMPHFEPTSNPLPESTKVNEGVALDLSILRDAIGDDDEAIAEILGEFRASAEVIMTEIQQSCGIGSMKRVRMGAHKLKSALRAVGAAPLGDLVERLEQVAAAGDSERAAEILAEVEFSMTDVFALVARIRAGSGG